MLLSFYPAQNTNSAELAMFPNYATFLGCRETFALGGEQMPIIIDSEVFPALSEHFTVLASNLVEFFEDETKTIQLPKVSPEVFAGPCHHAYSLSLINKARKPVPSSSKTIGEPSPWAPITILSGEAEPPPVDVGYLWNFSLNKRSKRGPANNIGMS